MATVVVMDDMDAMRMLLTDLLGSWGHQVLAFEDAAPALEGVDFSAVDLVITDLKMPTDGRTAIRWLRDQGFEVPIVVISGRVADGEEEDLRAMGVQAVLQKPPELRDLKAVVGRFLDPCMT